MAAKYVSRGNAEQGMAAKCVVYGIPLQRKAAKHINRFHLSLDIASTNALFPHLKIFICSNAPFTRNFGADFF